MKSTKKEKRIDCLLKESMAFTAICKQAGFSEIMNNTYSVGSPLLEVKDWVPVKNTYNNGVRCADI